MLFSDGVLEHSNLWWVDYTIFVCESGAVLVMADFLAFNNIFESNLYLMEGVQTSFN